MCVRVYVCEAVREMLAMCVGGLVIQPEDEVGGGGGDDKRGRCLCMRQ